MAEVVDITLTRVGQTFPVGTVVGLYKGMAPNAGVPQPVGPPLATATVTAEETLTFPAVSVDQKTYWAAAKIGGIWRFIQSTQKAGEIPAVFAEKGPKGDKGEKGEKGATGDVGPEGAASGPLVENAVETKYIKSQAVTASKIGILPQCRVWESSLHELLESDGVIAMSFNSERYDTDAMHSAGNPSRITATTAGLYHVFAHCSIVPKTATASQFRVELERSDGVKIAAQTIRTSAAEAEFVSVETDVQLSAGQYVVAKIGVVKGATINLQGSAGDMRQLDFGATWLSAF